MIAALTSSGIEVIECHVALWKSIEDRVNVTKGGWINPAFWWRLVRAYSKLLWQLRKVPEFDILMVGYPGQFDVFFAKLWAIFKRKPLVWDVFMSIYLVAKERGLDQGNKFIVNLIRLIESRALRLPDRLIQDTEEYVDWFHREYGVSPERFCLVPTGADDRIFTPTFSSKKNIEEKFIVLYYGTFIPNHGVMKIAQAAKYLAGADHIIFEFIGEGPEKEELEAFVMEHDLKNTRFLSWMSQEELLVRIENSDICLGAFGDTPQSLMTVQNKIYECMVMGKPVITGDSAAIRAAFPPDTIVVCDRSNPKELAQMIEMLSNNGEYLQTLARNARENFLENYSISSLGRRLKSDLAEILSSKETAT